MKLLTMIHPSQYLHISKIGILHLRTSLPPTLTAEQLSLKKDGFGAQVRDNKAMNSFNANVHNTHLEAVTPLGPNGGKKH